jgi:enoyl-CoA hydratase/carnithine racemase
LRLNQQVLRAIEALPVPVIGVANGLAVAGGLDLLCCDLILAAKGSKIGEAMPATASCRQEGPRCAYASA